MVDHIVLHNVNVVNFIHQILMNTNSKRDFTAIDRLLIGVGDALTTCAAPLPAMREFPSKHDDANLTESVRRQSGRYIRVNHVGEVCAQALYRGQKLFVRRPQVAAKMQQSADEETDHLAWCATRLDELGSRKSLLNPLWYGGAFTIGAAAGLAGDKWSLGFVAETERQVVAHLQSHLDKLAGEDIRSRELVRQMQDDENRHAQHAAAAGAAELPYPIKGMMKLAARVMTTTAYWI